MFLVRLLRYLKGYVRFSMTGGFVERFLNLCSRAGVPLWDMEPTKEGMESNTTIQHYKGLRGYAKRTGVRIRVKERHGMPFVVHRYRKRWGIGAGLVCFALFLLIMSNFIWNIRVVGNETLTEAEIIHNLEELGVKVGANRHRIDARWVERNMMLRLDKLAWIAVNITGSTAEIEVKERVLPPEKIDNEKQPTNVVASESGQIKRMEVYDGQAVVKEGDTVLKGDVIVSGILEDKKGKTTLKNARAKVIAQMPAELSVEVPLEQVCYYPTGKTTLRRSFSVFSLEIPLYLPGGVGEYYNKYESSRRLSLLGMELPFTLKSAGYEELKREVITYTETQALTEAQDQLLALEADAFQGAEIISKQPAASLEEGVLVLRAQYVIEKDIALTQEILVDEKPGAL